MLSTTTRALLAALLSCLLAAGLVAQNASGPLPDGFVNAGFEHLVQIERGGELPAEATPLWSEDYGAFRLARVDERTWPGGREGLLGSGLRLRDELDLVVLQGRRLDLNRPTDLLESIDPRERIGGDAELDQTAGLYLVSFRAPARDAWLAELETVGARVVQYLPMCSYVVAVAPENVARLVDLENRLAALRRVGVYEPAFRLREEISDAAENATGFPMPMTVQLVAGPDAAAALDRLAGLAASVLRVVPVGPYLNVGVDLDPVHARAVARDPSVFAIEPRAERRRLDEIQGQIMAGAVSGNVPTGPGYLGFLAGKGFGSGQFTGFSVNVVDDATVLTGHPDLPNGRIAFTNNVTNQGATQGGHGFLNANIVAGYNDQTGTLYEDSNGYQFGLGIAPWARVGTTAIFGSNQSPTPTNWENTAYSNGARISSNSWGFSNLFTYNSDAQEIDFLARDSRGSVSGNQEMTFIWAAGNDGSGSGTIGSPGTAKNCVTVGASENYRQTGGDGCGVGNSGANNVNQIINFSSRGPVDSGGGDGRWKPEIVAPGTHIQAGIPQSNYNGSSVCNQYWPNNGQTLYAWSSGTSHSTPAVAGGAALIRQDAINKGLPVPSPALTKAIIVGSGTYMGSTGGTLPSNSQGMGRLDLSRTFDGAPTMTVDQSVILGSTGAQHVVNGTVANAGDEFRVVLVWTDAPGSTTGAPYVNDLDLTVTIGGNTYRGNVFSGATSTTGGSADFRNNTESVFLPAGFSGAFTVTVTATTIAGNGVPGNTDGTDQDFALYIHNAGTGGGGGPSPLSDGSFEAQTAGSAPATPWTNASGGANLVLPTGGVATDNGLPSHGTKWLEVSASGSNAATPPSNIGGAGSPPANVSAVSQAFGYAAGDTLLTFDAAFIRNENANETQFNDFMSVDVTDGATWVNLYYADTFTATPNTSARHALPMTAVTAVSANLATLFPGSTTSTTFIVQVSCGNLVDGAQASIAYADDFRLETPVPLITSDFTGTPTSGFSPLTVNFTPMTTGTVSTYFWAFGDGSVSTAMNPSHVYSATGTYDVSLSVTGPDGSDTMTKTGYVTVTSAPPVSDFTASVTSGTAPLTVNFTAQTTGTVTSYLWNFGDGGMSTQANPSHVYSSAGNYDVSLTVVGPTGSDSETKLSYITVISIPAPVADFSGTPTSGTSPLTVNFSDLSTGSVTGWAWTFGDGGTSTAQNPSHTYMASGTYTVGLTATGPGGSDLVTKVGYVTVSSIPAPTADFTGTPTTGTAPLNVSFTAILGGGPTSSVLWNFGDGGLSTQTNPSHTYATPGIYDVTLTASGPGGSDLITKTGYVTVSMSGGAVTADFQASSTDVGIGAAVNFTNLSGGGATSFFWDFGDGTTSTAASPSHTYLLGGNFTVSLTATGPGGSAVETKINYIQVRTILSDDDLYLSFDAATTVPGVGAVGPEDVVRYDVATGAWSMVIDGSDLGLAGNDITGFHAFGNGQFLFSIGTTQNVPGVFFGPNGFEVTPNDILYFIPTSTGTNTAGFLYFVFDGSDVGLDGANEAIDGLFHDGVQFLAMSTIGATTTDTTAPTAGQDVLVFDVQSFLFVTVGTFSFAFDGSDLGLGTTSENIDALHFDASLGMYVSTEGALNASGVTGDQNDLVRFLGAFGPNTAGTLTKHYDLDLLGLPAGTNVNAISIVQQ
ncbi:MAG: PKD domain-containing protein [Planctomycetota bacterium]